MAFPPFTHSRHSRLASHSTPGPRAEPTPATRPPSARPHTHRRPRSRPRGRRDPPAPVPAYRPSASSPATVQSIPVSGNVGQSYYLQLRIDPLAPESAEELLKALVGEDRTLDPLRQVLIARTEGNPFFLEESVRSLVETQVLVGERGTYRLTKAPEGDRRGYFVGPRLLLSGRPVTHRYGHFYWCNGEADGLEAIRAVVRQLVAEGADHIKIMASGGATAGNIPYYASYTAEELRVAVETAHGLGRLTTAHCRAKQSMINALEAGLDCIEYGEFLVPGDIVEYGAGVSSSGIMQYDPHVTERILTQGTFVSFTFQAGGYDSLVELRAKRASDRLSPAEERRREALERYYEMKLGIFASLLADGMLPRLVVSSDAGPFDCEFGRMHYGMELAVAGGMTPLQAIEAATSVAARACGVAELTGSLEPAKEADLLVVNGNALDDVRCLADVAAVYKGGLKVGVLPPNALLPPRPA